MIFFRVVERLNSWRGQKMSLKTFTTVLLLLLLPLLLLLSSEADGSRLIRSRSDIPIEEELEQDFKDDLDRFEEIKQV